VLEMNKSYPNCMAIEQLRKGAIDTGESTVSM
jgi:hypothetical protein